MKISPPKNNDMFVVKQSQLKGSDRSFAVIEELKQKIKLSNLLYLDIGRLLKQIRDERLFTSYGTESFIHFINHAEIGMKQSKAYALIEIYEYFVERLGLAEEVVGEIPYTRLSDTIPHLRKLTDDQAREKIGAVGGLTNYDYREVLREGNFPERPVVYLNSDKTKWNVRLSTKSLGKIFLDELEIVDFPNLPTPNNAREHPKTLHLGSGSENPERVGSINPSTDAL